MTEDDIRRIIREELAARPPQVVVVQPPLPASPYPYHPLPLPTFPGGPWPVTCGISYGGIG